MRRRPQANRRGTGTRTCITFAEIFQRQPAFIQLAPLLSKTVIKVLETDQREELCRTERKRAVALGMMLGEGNLTNRDRTRVVPETGWFTAAIRPQADI